MLTAAGSTPTSSQTREDSVAGSTIERGEAAAAADADDGMAMMLFLAAAADEAEAVDSPRAFPAE